MTTIRHRSRQRLRIAALLALLAVGGVGCSLSGDCAAPPAGDLWRRTRDGWEEASWLKATVPDRAARFHPLSAALLQTMLVTMGLLTHTPASRNRHPALTKGEFRHRPHGMAAVRIPPPSRGRQRILAVKPK